MLGNFKADIIKEQTESDLRCASEQKWVITEINKAIAVLAHRTKDVNDLKAHIKWLETEITHTQNDIKSRQDRIAANNRLLEQFKKQRCDNNLLFVKNLRQHIEGIEIMGLLKQDLQDYFKSSTAKKTCFLEKFDEYSHLLDEEHKLILSQLTVELRNLPDAHVRTSAEIGTGHVDNSRGELTASFVPGSEEAAAYKRQLEAKIINMIDGLVLHLKNSRDELTRAEIKAGEDFAIFQTNMFKENHYLAERIKELTIHLTDIKAQLNVSQQQLVRREALRKKAEEQLKILREMKKEKDDYCRTECARRKRELGDVGNAQGIFQSVLDKASLRVKLRAQSNVEGKAYSPSVAPIPSVVQIQAKTEASLNAKQIDRKALALIDYDFDDI